MSFHHSANSLEAKLKSASGQPSSPRSTTSTVVTYNAPELLSGEIQSSLAPRPLDIKKDEAAEDVGVEATVRRPKPEAPAISFKVPRRWSSKRYSTKAMVTHSISTSSSTTRSSSGSHRISASPISPSTSHDSPVGESDLRVRKNRAEANLILTKNSAASQGRERYSTSPSAGRESSRPGSNVASRSSYIVRKTSLQSGIGFGPVKRPPPRAATVGSYLKTELHGTSEGRETPSRELLSREIPVISPTPFGPIGLRRTMSTTAAKGRDTVDLSKSNRSGRPSLDREIRRPQSANDNAKRGYVRWQPSTKRTMMSRVWSSFDLLNKSKSTAVLRTASETLTAPSQQDSHPEEIVEATASPREGLPQRSRSTTVSSAKTGPSTQGTVESNLDRTLASFPQPPRSSDLSFADTLAVSTAGNRSSELLLSNKLMPTIVTTRISLFPEVESVDTDGGQTIWIAVEVAGDVNLPKLDLESTIPPRALDVVVIFDTSAYTSSSCFKTAREIALHISAKLDQNVDRFAIICSADESGIPQVVAPLNSTDGLDVKSLLKSLERPRSDQQTIGKDVSHLRLAVDASIGMLQSTPKAPSTERHGHVFVLTANMGDWKASMTPESTARVHIVHPGPLPWKGQRGFSNGWQLRSLYPPKDGAKSLSTEKGSLAANIDNVLSHARIGTATGHITDMKISVTPGTNCAIEGILGSTNISVLRPGQTSSLFVKVKVGPFVLRKSSVPFFQSGRDGEEGIDLLTQLNAMLGEVSSDILTVDVTHKHTLFPMGTIMTASSNASLRRHTPQSEWNGTPAAPRLDDSSDFRNQLQQRLAFFIATNHSPREAIAALQDMFGLDGCLSVCPLFLRYIASELRYQSRVTERYRLSSSVDFIDYDDPPRNSINGFPGSLFDIGSQLTVPSILEQRPRIPSTIDERELSPERSPTNVPGSNSSLERVDGDSKDQARKIWSDMRRARRWGIHGSSGDVWENSDDSLLELKVKALKNKRSVGAETLNSFSFGNDPHRGRATTGISPWL